MTEIELCTVSGYNEVGRNMSALRIDDEVVLFDMGIQLDSYIETVGDEDIEKFSREQLIKAQAVPDDSKIKDWKNKVKAIICTHAHLDHIGAIPFLSNTYKCPIIGTPYTIEVLNAICKENGFKLKNKTKKLSTNSKYKVSDKITIELLNVTHSTPQTAIIAVDTPKGKVLYANDFKFDSFPVLGRKTTPESFKNLGKVHALIVDSLYASSAKKTPSESVAKAMLKDVLIGTNSENRAVIISTFSSHIARLSSIIRYGKKMGRKIILMGRSLAKYVEAAENIELVNFSKDVEIVKYGSQIKRKLKQIEKERSKYLLVCTGHQGEPRSVLSRIASGEFKFKIEKEDHVIFSCHIIPSKINQANRDVLEQNLVNRGVRLFRDIHVSGHGAREDLRDLIDATNPKHIIPTHGNLEKRSALADLAVEMGYESEKNIHLPTNSQRIILD